MRALREGLTHLSDDVHGLAYQLHPSILEELGLAEALRAECDRRDDQGQLCVSVDVAPLPDAIDPDVALCLLRIAQEALANVHRHAAASAVIVRLQESDGGLLLSVGDDGVGFEPADGALGGHLGLIGMRERVQLVGGTLDIESARGHGTTVLAWVPTKREPR